MSDAASMDTEQKDSSTGTIPAGNPAGVRPLAVDKATAAVMIAQSVRSLENYIALGLIETRKLGRRRVVLVRSLEKFLQRDQPSASPPKRANSTGEGQ